MTTQDQRMVVITDPVNLMGFRITMEMNLYAGLWGVIEISPSSKVGGAMSHAGVLA